MHEQFGIHWTAEEEARLLRVLEKHPGPRNPTPDQLWQRSLRQPFPHLYNSKPRLGFCWRDWIHATSAVRAAMSDHKWRTIMEVES